MFGSESPERKRLEVMDGWETIRRLQSDPDTRHIPVIAITGHQLA
jgi:two-component system cell cycle response regulator DivK